MQRIDITRQISDKWNVTNPRCDGQLLDGFSQLAFESEEAARLAMEHVRWPEGVYCPKCGSVEKCWRIRSRDGGRSGVRAGVWRCSFCRCQFTVTVGTALQNTRLPLRRILRGLTFMSRNRDPWAVRELRAVLGTSH
ncbi:MAG: transposase, partial [Bryobacterales bacterium]|nr:transposase [Bryobacterales bacterium]